MVAVLELIQSLGGCWHAKIASPIACVVFTLDCRISFLLVSLYLQSTDFPARLMTRSAPLKAFVMPSLSFQRTSPFFLAMIITLSPLLLNLSARNCPRKPVPPAMTIFFKGKYLG